jgi:HlyD family secretion protein
MTVQTLLMYCALTLTLSACGSKAPPTAQAAVTGDTIAAGGLVEPIGEERVLIPEIGGRLARVAIAEGDTVKRGQILAEIDNRDYAAQVAAAEAQVALRSAELDKLRHGARVEERDEARAQLAEAAAQLDLATREATRRRTMVKQQLVAREAADQAETNESAARARRDAAQARVALLAAGTRAEDIAMAEAALLQAQAALTQAQALFEKTIIRSPVDGVVLKRDLREGETVVALSPIPLARIGDVSRLIVRADVDELDVARVRVGQRARITSDAFPGRVVNGEVIRVSQRMGQRNMTRDTPTEKVDSKVLEAEIALEEGAALPIGLRVDVVIQAR